MKNIILDEKRFVNEGEVVAIELKRIEGYKVIKDFDELLYISSDLGIYEGITFIQYLGNGKFIDLVSDHLLRTVVINSDDFGSAEYRKLDLKSQDELKKISEQYSTIIHPNNNDEVLFNYNMLLNNPLAIEIDSAPFYKIDDEVLTRFFNQDLIKLKSTLSSAKQNAVEILKASYNQSINNKPKQKALK